MFSIESEVVQLQETLNSIETKINNCDSLFHVLDYYRHNRAIPKELKNSTEAQIIETYLDLMKVCKKNKYIRQNQINN